MQKLIIVGNGFDLAHHLKTRYQDFAKGYSDDPRLQEFQSLVAAMNQDGGFANEKANDGHEIRWYDFEMCMEHLSNWILYKSIADNSEQTRLLYDAQMKRCNRLFDDISTRLAQYLRIETEGKEIDKIDSIAQEITNDTQVISFNYTNTIKLYTDKCYYVHGSIDEDKGNIVLGFPQNNIPDFVRAAGRMSGQPVQRSRRICFSQRACALPH